MIHPIILGKTLTQYRKFFNLSQNDVARLLGVTNQAVSKWELGNSTPSITILWILSEIFLIDVKTLLTFDNNSQTNLYPLNKNPSNYFIKRNQRLVSGNTIMSKSFFFDCTGENIEIKSTKINQCIYTNSKFLNIFINDSKLDCTNFTNCKLNKVFVENSSLLNIRLLTNLQTCSYKQCNFNNCISINETFKECRFDNCMLSECSCNKSIFSNNYFSKTKIINSIFFDTSFYYCNFNDVQFINNTLNKCNFVDCTFDKKTYQMLKKLNVSIARPNIK
jgi:transcriptional regulator with XRE-family HTH domain